MSEELIAKLRSPVAWKYQRRNGYNQEPYWATSLIDPKHDPYYRASDIAIPLYDSGNDIMDATRYRYLKEHHIQLGPDCWIRTGADLDDAIDEKLRESL